ncbi:unnamed protein product [Amoebophrya sp. A120]|nr:unnamed protein product [Amoebophrya sp. A120]|eukprot:GSA120T00009427001.1
MSHPESPEFDPFEDRREKILQAEDLPRTASRDVGTTASSFGPAGISASGDDHGRDKEAAFNSFYYHGQLRRGGAPADLFSTFGSTPTSGSASTHVPSSSSAASSSSCSAASSSTEDHNSSFDRTSSYHVDSSNPNYTLQKSNVLSSSSTSSQHYPNSRAAFRVVDVQPVVEVEQKYQSPIKKLIVTPSKEQSSSAGSSSSFHDFFRNNSSAAVPFDFETVLGGPSESRERTALSPAQSQFQPGASSPALTIFGTLPSSSTSSHVCEGRGPDRTKAETSSRDLQTQQINTSTNPRQESFSTSPSADHPSAVVNQLRQSGAQTFGSSFTGDDLDFLASSDVALPPPADNTNSSGSSVGRDFSFESRRRPVVEQSETQATVKRSPKLQGHDDDADPPVYNISREIVFYTLRSIQDKLKSKSSDSKSTLPNEPRERPVPFSPKYVPNSKETSPNFFRSRNYITNGGVFGSVGADERTSPNQRTQFLSSSSSPKTRNKDVELQEVTSSPEGADRSSKNTKAWSQKKMSRGGGGGSNLGSSYSAVATTVTGGGSCGQLQHGGGTTATTPQTGDLALQPGQQHSGMMLNPRKSLHYYCWKCCTGVVACFDFVLRLLGPILVLLAFVLYGFVTYVYMRFCVPVMDFSFNGAAGGLGSSSASNGNVDVGPHEELHSEANRSTAAAQSPTLHYLDVFCGFFLLWNICYNHWTAMRTSPGYPPKYDVNNDELFEMLGNSAHIDVPQDLESGQPKVCHKCDRIKPARAHHCSVCRQCVLKMDHHCPWINNCVGFGNYQYFVLFLFWLYVGVVFVLITCYAQFLEIFYHPSRSRHRDFNHREYVGFMYILCASICLALSLLGGFHLYLLLTNQTTIEFQLNWIEKHEAKKRNEPWRNVYDLGPALNYKQVMGESLLLGCFPWLGRPKRRVEEGLSFPKTTRFHV